SRRIRRAAIELAELDADAEQWRAEIHSDPGPGIADRLREWLSRGRQDATAEAGYRLVADLERLYGRDGRRERLEQSLDRMRNVPASSDWAVALADVSELTAWEQIPRLCTALADARSSVLYALPSRERLALLDAMQNLDTEAFVVYQDIDTGGALSRAELLALSAALIDCSYGAGLLSGTERATLVKDLSLENVDTLELAEYRRIVARLKRAPSWAVGTIRHTFAEALVRYSALEPGALRFSDDLLRGSSMWLLGDTLKVLSRDLDAIRGSVVQFNGRTVASAVALNGGIAKGRLRIFETIQAVESSVLQATDIVVLPETIAELSPVAGILTLGEGNPLSHVQLLARNFGIPNVAIGQEAVEYLRAIENSTVVLVVDNDGNVILRLDDSETAGLFADLATAQAQSADRFRVPLPDLNGVQLLPLSALRRELSGRLVGPKAANLGELNRLFPGRVAPAIAVPFGVYAAHLQAANLSERVNTLFNAKENGDMSAVEFNRSIATVRVEIAALNLDGQVRSELIDLMHELFGEPGTYGVFVRSDTNVEDLPRFTGAGLNETVPNVVGLDAQLNAIPRVWSSVFSPRALAWRSNVLENPEHIYASVLLMKSVPATKSGVLVTANLFDRELPALTASVAWGVGGAVAGEPAETTVIQKNSTEIYSEAKTAYQREIVATGGVALKPAPAGPVLSANEISALRRLAVEVKEKYAPVFDDAGHPRPWDIEFGFVDGELTLFQIRPLVERGNRTADSLLRQLLPDIESVGKGSTTVYVHEWVHP
ncbi:MAG: PEP/pyruvate-binding domain-containing protein, partial [Woeseia sp.]